MKSTSWEIERDRKNFRAMKVVWFWAVILSLGLCLRAFALGQEAAPEKKQEAALPEGKKIPLPAFGYDIFRPMEEPLTGGPVDEQFLLSPGDEVIISVWGQLNLMYPLVISDDGYIEIPEGGGRIYANGVTLKELRRLVNEGLSRIYSGYINLQNPSQSTAFADVKLGRIHQIVAYIVGEVKNQGAYTVSTGAATLLNLLNSAGGVKENGSLRQIKIRRRDGSIDNVDLYDLLITGKIDPQKTQIRFGEYIIVPIKGKSVVIQGEIKRPAVYETVGKEGIRSLINFAGGLTANAYLKRIQIKRVEVNTGEKFYDLDLDKILADPQQDFVLEDGDEITIFPNIVARGRFVEIKGDGVARPGIYEFKPGMTVRDLIEQADGMREDVYLDRADLTRTDQQFVKKLMIFKLRDIYREDKPGHFIFTGDADKNFTLQELDQITLYSTFTMRGGEKNITLEGHVKEPGTYALFENMSLYDLIFSKGGLEDQSFRKTTFLELGHVFRKVPGEVGEKILSFHPGRLLQGDPKENIQLQDKDRVVLYALTETQSKPNVTIRGLVQRPDEYPFAEDLTLEDLILMAGGLNPSTFKVEAFITRINGGSENRQVTAKSFTVPISDSYASLPREKRAPLEAFDRIDIRSLPGWEPPGVVTVFGEVVYPGNFTLESATVRISSVIKKAGGLRDDALPEGGRLYRQKYIVDMTPSAGEEPELIAIDLRQALEKPGSASDIILKDGDQIYVPTNPGTVEVRGAVRYPSTLHYQKGLGVSDYIDLCGGFLKNADQKETLVYFANHTAQKPRPTLFSRMSLDILPGSIIEVPSKEEEKGQDTIKIQGAVKFPLTVVYKKGQKLDYYVNMCGGYRDEADVGNITVRLPDGTVLSSKGIAPFNPDIPAGAVIEVPTKPAKQTEEKR